MTDHTETLHLANTDDDNHRLVTEQGARDIYERLANTMTGGGVLELYLTATWRGSLRWARNRVSLASDERDIRLLITRQTRYGGAQTVINQIDDASLSAAMKEMERQIKFRSPSEWSFHGKKFTDSPQPYPETTSWSDATYNVMPEQRAKLAQMLIPGAEEKGLLSAGYIQMIINEAQRFGDKISDHRLDWMPSNEPPQGQGATRTARDEGYMRNTGSQCSMTVRHPKGTGSGWAGLAGYDWSVIDSGALSQRALDKCIASLNPFAIEPGRYVVILEPEAVGQFVNPLIQSMGNRAGNEDIQRPALWSEDVDPTLRMRMTKLGQVVLDDRITIATNPMDPRLGATPSLGLGPVTWVEKGRLQTLAYNRPYALNTLREDGSIQSSPYYMSGGTTTMEEMIATTERGIIVTRFSNMREVRGAGFSLLQTGLTRDGLWLVENGKISKAVKNMRFTDSPLFVFNQVEQIGIPVRTFGSGFIPPIKSRDFAFTATIDAI